MSKSELLAQLDQITSALSVQELWSVVRSARSLSGHNAGDVHLTEADGERIAQSFRDLANGRTLTFTEADYRSKAFIASHKV